MEQVGSRARGCAQEQGPEFRNGELSLRTNPEQPSAPHAQGEARALGDDEDAQG